MNRLPDNYMEHSLLFADWQGPDWLLLGFANALALLPLAVGVLLVWLPYQFYLVLGAPLAVAHWEPLGWGTAVLLTLLFTFLAMLLHELLHGFALRWCGYSVRFGWQGGFLYAGAGPDEYLTRHHYLILTITPLLVIPLLGIPLLLFLPSALGKLWLIPILLNFPASIGDLLVAYRVYRQPSHALFNSQTNIRVFLPPLS